MEPINPQLDALLHERFDDPATLAVYADWLEERGEPRAELIRVRGGVKSSRKREALIAKHWDRWFGALEPRGLKLEWTSGFPTAATCASTPAATWSLPSLRFLRRVKATAGQTLAGLEHLPSLRQLAWRAPAPGSLAPLGTMVLARLESFRLQLHAPSLAEDLAGLSAASLPSLREFSFQGSRVDEPLVLATVLGASWFSTLTTLKLPLSCAETLAPLLSAADALQRLGAGLTIFGPPPFLGAARSQLRQAFPRAMLRPSPPRSSPESTFTVLVGSAAPVLAPAKFSALPPRPDRLFSYCVSCASGVTREIFRTERVEEGEGETTTFTSSEYECFACHRFTHWEHVGTVEDAEDEDEAQSESELAPCPYCEVEDCKHEVAFRSVENCDWVGRLPDATRKLEDQLEAALFRLLESEEEGPFDGSSALDELIERTREDFDGTEDSVGGSALVRDYWLALVEAAPNSTVTRVDWEGDSPAGGDVFFHAFCEKPAAGIKAVIAAAKRDLKALTPHPDPLPRKGRGRKVRKSA